jgi:hypothetical protein
MKVVKERLKIDEEEKDYWREREKVLKIKEGVKIIRER